MARFAAYMLSFVAISACGDSPTMPQPIAPAQAALVLPCVKDAQLRIAAGIRDPVLRERTNHHFEQMARALSEGSREAVELHLRFIEDLIREYLRQPAAATRPDASDLTALGSGCQAGPEPPSGGRAC